jgi:cyclic pyranopterin phosphate synthase
MIDSFGRRIGYLRVSVTDRCNLNCRYCTPPGGMQFLRREHVVSFEEIVAVVRAAVDIGITKVRLTGGEPLLRTDVVQLVEVLGRIEGIGDLAMTTNGTLLAQHAGPLAAAGLHRVNVSLDTTDPARYRELTRGGDFTDVVAGIDAAERAGLMPIKLNCVTGSPSNDAEDDADVRSVKEFGRIRGLQVRIIRRMNLQTGLFHVVEGGSGGDCRRCDRLRLSSDAMIRPCLFSDLAFSVRQLGAVEAIDRAVAAKPAGGRPCTHDWMHGIGG